MCAIVIKVSRMNSVLFSTGALLKCADKTLTTNHHVSARRHDVGYVDGGSSPRAGVRAACLRLALLRHVERMNLASRRYVRSSLLDCRPRDIREALISYCYNNTT